MRTGGDSRLFTGSLPLCARGLCDRIPGAAHSPSEKPPLAIKDSKSSSSESGRAPSARRMFLRVVPSPHPHPGWRPEQNVPIPGRAWNQGLRTRARSVSPGVGSQRCRVAGLELQTHSGLHMCSPRLSFPRSLTQQPLCCCLQ